MSRLSIEQIDKVLNLIEENRSVEAVKFLVDSTDYSLREAKELVDHLTENPNADPQLMNISHSRHKLHHLENEFTQTTETRSMSSIMTHYSTRQVFIKYDNGDKVEIDEFHPAWHQAMQKFGRGTLYTTKHDFLEAMQSHSDEFSNYESTLNTPHQMNNDHLRMNPHASSQSSQGVEDLTQKSGIPKLMILLIVVLLGVAIVSYILQG